MIKGVKSNYTVINIITIKVFRKLFKILQITQFNVFVN